MSSLTSDRPSTKSIEMLINKYPIRSDLLMLTCLVLVMLYLNPIILLCSVDMLLTSICYRMLSDYYVFTIISGLLCIEYNFLFGGEYLTSEYVLKLKSEVSILYLVVLDLSTKILSYAQDYLKAIIIMLYGRYNNKIFKFVCFNHLHYVVFKEIIKLYKFIPSSCNLSLTVNSFYR